MPALARGFSREEQPEQPEDGAGSQDNVTVLIEGDDEQSTDQGTLDPASGALTIEIDDGKVVIDLNPQTKKRSGEVPDFGANLAEHMSDGDLGKIAGELIQAIDSDDRSRQEWLQNRAKCIDMLGFKLEEPRGDTGASTAPIEGMATIRNPLLTEACIRFQSNAGAELLPAGGPVKVRNDSPIKPENADETPVPGIGADGASIVDTPVGLTSDDLAESLEKDLNHYLLRTDKGYRADTDRMLFWVGFGGAAFKKVYHCPIKRMPLSRSVDASDLIVANSANDLDDCGRITHRIKMRRSTLIRMQLAGVYREIESLTTNIPQDRPNPVDEKIASVQGFRPSPDRPEDNEFTIYESYVELDLPGFQHEDEDGDPTGLELPYRVTIEKDSQRILEIRRNWEEDDENCLAKRVFVKFPFIPAMGFYDIGLSQILGNATKGLTAAWRMMLDAGMFASFPGFIYSDVAGRQVTNEFRVAPGSGIKIQTGSRSVQEVIMPLPYKDVTPGLAALVQNIQENGQRVGGTAELQVGEGRQDAPVGTTLALIEQATKMLAAVHKRLHAAQSEEFQLLKALFREDPAAFWRYNKRPARRWEVEEFLAALDNCDVVPAADPNTASHMQRIMKAVAVKQLQAMSPQIYNAKAVDTRILRDIGVIDPEMLFLSDEQMQAAQQSAQPPGDPTAAATLQLKQQALQQKQDQAMQDRVLDMQSQEKQAQAREQEISVESADRASDRQSRERVAGMREQTEQIKSQSELAMHQASLDAEGQKHSEELAHQATQQHQDRQLQVADGQQQAQERQQDRTLDQANRSQDQALDHMNRQQDRQVKIAGLGAGPGTGPADSGLAKPPTGFPRPI